MSTVAAAVRTARRCLTTAVTVETSDLAVLTPAGEDLPPLPGLRDLWAPRFPDLVRANS
ncbi:MAG TPA: hypothetical protein VGG20_05905 [Thermoanaerobaculia bacterium]